MRIIECDRCHKRFNKDTKKTGYINLDQRDIKTGELEGNREFDEWDLCDDCMKLIRDFVRMVPPVRQEPDRPGSNVPKQPTVPPMPKGFKAVDVKRGFDTQKWAEAVAEMMEEKDREKDDDELTE